MWRTSKWKIMLFGCNYSVTCQIDRFRSSTTQKLLTDVSSDSRFHSKHSQFNFPSPRPIGPQRNSSSRLVTHQVTNTSSKWLTGRPNAQELIMAPRGFFIFWIYLFGDFQQSKEWFSYIENNATLYLLIMCICTIVYFEVNSPTTLEQNWIFLWNVSPDFRHNVMSIASSPGTVEFEFDEISKTPAAQCARPQASELNH